MGDRMKHFFSRRASGTRGIAIGVGVLLIAASASATNGAAAANGILKVATSAAVTTWDPVQSFSTEAFYMTSLYEPLIWKNEVGAATDYSPALATTWSHSKDGLTWTFNLRSGATFHDGSVVNAAAVKASLDSAKKDGGASFIWDPVKSIEVVDADTVAFHLSYSAPLDLIVSSSYGAWIVNPKALDAVAKDAKYYESGIDAGSGPYTLTSYSPGTEVVMSAYPKYWGPKPAYSIVDALITSDGVTAQQMLTSGQVDFASNIPLTSMASLKSNHKYKVKAYGSPFNYVGYFNTLRAPLNNPVVRQALSMAIPYSDIVKVGGQGYATQARGPVPAGIFPYDSATPQYKKALATAKTMLAKAGVKNLKLKITYASENGAEARFAPLIKSAFESIGVSVDIQAMLFSQQWSLAKKDPANAQDLFIVYYWPTYSDAGSDNLYSLFHSSAKPFFNLSYWKNTQYDDLIDKAATLTGTDRAASAALYSQAMKILYDQAPGISFYDTKAVYVVPKAITGFTYNINYPFSLFFAKWSPTK